MPVATRTTRTARTDRAVQTVEEVLASFPPFAGEVDEPYRYSEGHMTTFQVNVGYKCNLACRHCHLCCSPARTEEMSCETMQACLDAFALGGYDVFDITGGAPEMNPNLEWLIQQVRERSDADIVVRTNLCILLEPEYEHFFDVYDRYDVHLFASLPAYSAGNCDKVRGDGTFMANIEVLERLNGLGFGTGKHRLTLVYGPPGPTLPPSNAETEAEYHRRLKADFGIEFTDLVTMTNMPCGRFAETLNRKGRLGRYMEKLMGAFNPDTVPDMMCRKQVSVDWQGRLYDCDFNQAMGLPLLSGETVFDWAEHAPEPRRIAFRNWCYACTAGSGST